MRRIFLKNLQFFQMRSPFLIHFNGLQLVYEIPWKNL